MFGPVSAPGRFWSPVRRQLREGGGAVAFAAAAPLFIVALAVAADYASVSHFRGRVQLAADAASLAAADTIARRPEVAGRNDADDIAAQVAANVFVRDAPRGAGRPTIALKSRAAAVTADVGYAGVAPSNFGAVLGYDAISVEASAISPTRVADFRSTLAR